MDGLRLDLISKWLVASSSRRSTLRALAAGAFAAGLGRLDPDDASAKCLQFGKKCRRRKKRGKNGNGKGQKCCGGALCNGRRCSCSSGQQHSGGVCYWPPICNGYQEPCTVDGAASCCSHSCSEVSGCGQSEPGEPCHEDVDCALNDICVGFVCKTTQV